MMEKGKKKYVSESLRNVTKISSGTMTGQIVSIVTLPFITRLYGAEIIGTWTVVTAFANIVTNICDLGLTNSLMMCENDRIQTLYSIVIKISGVTSWLSGIVLFIYYLLIGENFMYALMVCGFMAIYAFALRWINICTTLLNRNKEYNVLMKNSVIRFTGVAIVSIGLGTAGFTSFGYYIGNVLGQFITIIHMMRYLPNFIFHHELNAYIQEIKMNLNYVRYQMPASIMTTLRTELPNLLIGRLFGNTMLGYFSISQKLLTIPVTFLGQSLGKVFYQKTAEMRLQGLQIGAFVERNINRGMIIALFPMTVFAAFGDAAIVLYFGTEYAIGGVICRIIVYRSLFNFISTATQGIDIVLDKQQYVLYTCFSQTVLAVVSVLCGYYIFDSIYITSALLAGTFILIQLIYFHNMYRVMELNPMKYIRNMGVVIVSMFLLSTVLRTAMIWFLEVVPIDLFEKFLTYFVMEIH